MKGILVLLDGLGDLPDKRLNMETPLESAKTPNLDFLAARGELGEMYPVKPGFKSESGDAILSIFKDKLTYSSRGELEAKGSGVKVTRGDLVWRVNFATVDFKKNEIIDRRAGRTLTDKETRLLSKAINKIKLPCEFLFKPTIHHRGVLVFRGGFSDNLLGNDSAYFKGINKNQQKIIQVKPLDNLENTQYSSNIVNEFLDKAHEILENHPVNLIRKKKGLLPANFLLVRSPGIEIPKLKQYKNWLSINYMPLEKGFSELSGMKNLSFKYPKLKDFDVYKNLWNALKKASSFSIKSLKKNYKKFDYAFISFKEVNFPGQDNKIFEKKDMIEYLDKTFFKFLRKFSTFNKINVIITSNHSTPCKLKANSIDPVPVLFYNNLPPRKKKFCEKECKKGNLRRIIGSELLKKTNFLK